MLGSLEEETEKYYSRKKKLRVLTCAIDRQEILYLDGERLGGLGKGVTGGAWREKRKRIRIFDLVKICHDYVLLSVTKIKNGLLGRCVWAGSVVLKVKGLDMSRLDRRWLACLISTCPSWTVEGGSSGDFTSKSHCLLWRDAPISGILVGTACCAVMVRSTVRPPPMCLELHRIRGLMRLEPSGFVSFSVRRF